MAKLYPGSHVEVSGMLAKHYDFIMDAISLGSYRWFIKDAIRRMEIMPAHSIMVLGAGTGRNAKLMTKYLGPKGKITAFEIGEEMRQRFQENLGGHPNVELRNQRIDEPFELDQPADKAFICFVIHGLPHPNRLKVLENVFNNLKPGGLFHILDFAEEMRDKNALIKGIFKTAECPYAWDYVNRNWERIYNEYGFEKLSEFPYFLGTIKLTTLRRKNER